MTQIVAIAAKLTDTTAASTFLSTPALTVTVEQVASLRSRGCNPCNISCNNVQERLNPVLYTRHHRRPDRGSREARPGLTAALAATLALLAGGGGGGRRRRHEHRAAWRHRGRCCRHSSLLEASYLGPTACYSCLLHGADTIRSWCLALPRWRSRTLEELPRRSEPNEKLRHVTGHQAWPTLRILSLFITRRLPDPCGVGRVVLPQVAEEALKRRNRPGQGLERTCAAVRGTVFCAVFELVTRRNVFYSGAAWTSRTIEVRPGIGGQTRNAAGNKGEARIWPDYLKQTLYNGQHPPLEPHGR